MRLNSIDAYLLRRMATPMAAALAVTLAALLLERVLRLFELLTGKGAPVGLVISMTMNLVPHYLGLALPAAFAVGVISVMTSLSANSELDAMESAGLSVRRIGAVFIGCGVLLTFVSLFLFGYVQPYSRYAFQAVKHELVNAAWDARVEAGTFIDAGDGLTIFAGEVDPTGRFLEEVFVRQLEFDGSERILTSEEGVLIPDVAAGVVRLRLKDGVAVSVSEKEGEVSVHFEQMTMEREFSIDGEIFRPRGDSERELTLNELAAETSWMKDGPVEPRFAAELYGRLIRALALIGVPLIAVPLAVAGKRTPPWRRVALALALLVAFQNTTKTLEAMASNGDIAPGPALWGTFAGYMALGFWLFTSTASQGSDNVLRKLFVFIDAVIRRIPSGEAQAQK